MGGIATREWHRSEGVKDRARCRGEIEECWGFGGAEGATDEWHYFSEGVGWIRGEWRESCTREKGKRMRSGGYFEGVERSTGGWDEFGKF